MMSNVSGQGNTGLGNYSLLANSAGNNNVAIGNYALQATAGSTNVGVGTHALYSNTTGYSNVAVGTAALYKSITAHNLVAIGDSALFSHITQYGGNTAVGSKALFANTFGEANTATGYNALQSVTTGNYNTANGYNALKMNTGNSNTAIGTAALTANTSGFENTALGTQALYSNNQGYSNTAAGYNALFANNSGNNNNSAFGENASKYADGSNNTCIGYSAGDFTYFTNGTFLGATAYSSSPNVLVNCMALGYDARVNASNKVVIGNTTVTTIGGYAGWTTYPSDRKFKKNISENVPGLAFISQLRPVTYQMELDKLSADLKEDQQRDADGKFIIGSPSSAELAARNEKSQNVYTGFIAQEVEAAAKALGYNFSGVDAPKNENDFYGLRYAEFVVPLVKGMQEQQTIIEAQQKQIGELLKRIEALEKK
jgi:hypothetical protein